MYWVAEVKFKILLLRSHCTSTQKFEDKFYKSWEEELKWSLFLWNKRNKKKKKQQNRKIILNRSVFTTLCTDGSPVFQVISYRCHRVAFVMRLLVPPQRNFSFCFLQKSFAIFVWLAIIRQNKFSSHKRKTWNFPNILHSSGGGVDRMDLLARQKNCTRVFFPLFPKDLKISSDVLNGFYSVCTRQTRVAHQNVEKFLSHHVRWWKISSTRQKKSRKRRDKKLRKMKEKNSKVSPRASFHESQKRNKKWDETRWTRRRMKYASKSIFLILVFSWNFAADSTRELEQQMQIHR